MLAAIFCVGSAMEVRAASMDALAANRGVVEIETGRAADVSVQMTEEIAGIVDDGATRRIVPVVGKGPLQNLNDLKYLRGIDLAIVPTDVLEVAREQRSLSGIGSLTYVSKLYNEELHLLCRDDVKTVGALNDKIVNVDVKGSATSITAARVFGLLDIKPILANDDQNSALQKLRSGTIAALAYVTAKPAPLFRNLNGRDGLHFLSIPLTEAITAAYPPTQLTASDYPTLIPAEHPSDTIAVGSVIIAADVRGVPERYRNVSNFIETFFTGFPQLLKAGHNAKWQDVSVSAELPGWTRHPAAAQWLQRNNQVAVAAPSAAMSALFSRFIDERRQATGGAPMSAADKDALFQQFETWQRGQAH
jgi:TRAP-type uncharacterized transport system substrate-binding protein